jgi:flagellar assembly protein FliH
VTPRARIVPASDAARARPLLEPGLSDGPRRRIARVEIEARLAAERIVSDAHAEANAIVAEARDKAAASLVEASEEARKEAHAELAAKWLALRQAEQHAIDREGERLVPIAVVLAERLLGASLALDPSLIVDLTRAVLDETRGARRAMVDAHPLDAAELRERLTTNGLDLQSVEVRSDEALARGELRLHTDVGTIDARLAPRFERLAATLRDALK